VTAAVSRALRVAAYTSGPDIPGARFRVRQFVPALAQEAVSVSEYWPHFGAYPPAAKWLRPAWLAGTLLERVPQVAASFKADVSWIYRELVSTLVTLEGAIRRPRVLDVDDAVHLHRGGRTAKRLAELCDTIIVASPYLAEAWRGWSRSVEIVPMAIDVHAYQASPLPKRPVIGWLGSPSNARYFEQIGPALERVLRRFPDVSFAVCSEARPNVPFTIAYTPWSAAAEAPFLSSLSIGLVPIEDDAWGRGKFSYKMLQYMASGRPCVASPVGTSGDLLKATALGLPASTQDEWVEALSSLVSDRAGAATMGANGRALAVEAYSVEAVAPRLAQIFRRAA
jgi:glycosyltransferase involved in cell wall biosynthesis